MSGLLKKVIISCGVVTALMGGIAVANQQDTHQPSYTESTRITEEHGDQEELQLDIGSDIVQDQPAIEIKTETKTSSIPFETQYTEDNTVAQGETRLVQDGINGVETIFYSVTYTDGVETAREVTKTETTKPSTPRIIARGTHVAPQASTAPNCTSGTYVNSAGDTVCRPVQSETRPAGATARCGDGSYSYSQSRRGTCSHHGGVAQWY